MMSSQIPNVSRDLFFLGEGGGGGEGGEGGRRGSGISIDKYLSSVCS